MPFGGLPLAEDDVINFTWAYCRLHAADDTAIVYVHSSDIMATTKSTGKTSFHRILAAGLNADETHALLATTYRYNSAKVINHHYRPPCLQKNCQLNQQYADLTDDFLRLSLTAELTAV